jgi:hypothetical protein
MNGTRIVPKTGRSATSAPTGTAAPGRSRNPGVEVWVALRDVVFRKYQRRRVPYRLLQGLDAKLEELGVKVDKVEEQ